MIFKVAAAVYNADYVKDNAELELRSKLFDDTQSHIKAEMCHAYHPFINAHDHLISNWYPPARDRNVYTNAHIWVNEMRDSESVQERNRVFVNSIPMNFNRGNGKLLAILGCYKNIFSGVTILQDHAPKQAKSYYDLFPINVVRNYRQCHSLTLGNFWGGEEPVDEWKATEGKEPFILHLGEGLDEKTRNEFSLLKEMNLLQPNTMIIHGISLSKKEIEECAQTGSTICWCPFSNYFLIGKTLDIDACLEYGTNVVIATDSTLSGSINILQEIRFAQSKFPHIEMKTIYRMISQNAVRALFLPEKNGGLSEKTNENILLINAKKKDPMENLTVIDYDDIVLLVHKAKPLYGHRELLNPFAVDEEDYYFYKKKGIERFVIGHPEKIMEKISDILGYKKELPYLPFP